MSKLNVLNVPSAGQIANWSTLQVLHLRVVFFSNLSNVETKHFETSHIETKWTREKKRNFVQITALKQHIKNFLGNNSLNFLKSCHSQMYSNTKHLVSQQLNALLELLSTPSMGWDAGQVESNKSYEKVSALEVTPVSFSLSHSDKPAPRFCCTVLQLTDWCFLQKKLNVWSKASVPVILDPDAADCHELNDFCPSEGPSVESAEVGEHTNLPGVVKRISSSNEDSCGFMHLSCKSVSFAYWGGKTKNAPAEKQQSGFITCDRWKDNCPKNSCGVK